MDSPKDKSPLSMSSPPPGTESKDPSEESAFTVRDDRLYQIAALTAGIILLATVF